MYNVPKLILFRPNSRFVWLYFEMLIFEKKKTSSQKLLIHSDFLLQITCSGIRRFYRQNCHGRLSDEIHDSHKFMYKIMRPKESTVVIWNLHIDVNLKFCLIIGWGNCPAQYSVQGALKNDNPVVAIGTECTGQFETASYSEAVSNLFFSISTFYNHVHFLDLKPWIFNLLEQKIIFRKNQRNFKIFLDLNVVILT